MPLTGLDLHFCPMGKNNGSPRSSPRRQRSSALHSMGSSPYPHNKKSETPTGSRFSWCRCSVAVPCIFGGGQSRLENTDRCHSLGSLPLPPAALPSLPRLSPTVRSPTDTRKASPLRAGFSGAVDGTRTRTVSPPGDFKLYFLSRTLWNISDFGRTYYPITKTFQDRIILKKLK